MEIALGALALIVLFGACFVLSFLVKRGFSPKMALRLQFIIFGIILISGFALPLVVNAVSSSDASAQAVPESAGASSLGIGIAMLGAAITFGLSALGAGKALASSTPAAIAAMSENPQSFGKSLVLVALAESLPILGMVVSLIIITKF